MPRIDFYILGENKIPQRFVCNLVSKVIAEGNRIHIHAQSRDEAETLDDSLWTFRDISFLPHAMADQADAPDHPVVIGWPGSARTNADVLINLALEGPENPEQFERVLELVGSRDNNRQLARTRYRRYREAGYELHSHNMDQSHA